MNHRFKDVGDGIARSHWITGYQTWKARKKKNKTLIYCIHLKPHPSIWLERRDMRENTRNFSTYQPSEANLMDSDGFSKFETSQKINVRGWKFIGFEKTPGFESHRNYPDVFCVAPLYYHFFKQTFEGFLENIELALQEIFGTWWN